MKNLNKLNNKLLFFLFAVYIIALALSNPFGNFAINDDWDFALHVGYFLDGHFIKNNLIDSAFIFQGFLGMIWAKLFGLSFTSLRILTMIFSVIMAGGCYKLLKTFNTDKKVIAIVLLTILFNPLVFASSLSFMTEIYFATLMVWSLYFFIKYHQNEKFQDLLVALGIAGASMLTRQFGVVMFITFIIGLCIKNYKNLKPILLTLLVFVCFFSVSFFWPQYETSKTRGEKLSGLFLSQEAITERLYDSQLLFPYIAFFLSPFIVMAVSRQKYYITFLLFCASVFLVTPILDADIFGLGNVLYVEGLYAKNDFYTTLSLTDNIIFKLGFSFYLAFLIFQSIYIFLKNVREYKIDISYLIIVICALGMFLTAFLTKEFYDRYFLNFFILITIIYGIKLNPQKWKWSVLPILFLATFTVMLNHDYMTATALKWKQAEVLQKERGLKTGIYVTGAYSRYIYTLDKPANALDKEKSYGDYVCFIQRYTTDNKKLKNFTTSLEENLELTNPKILNSSYTRNYKKVPSDKSKLIANEEYVTPLFSFVGKKSYIGAFCPSDR